LISSRCGAAEYSGALKSHLQRTLKFFAKSKEYAETIFALPTMSDDFKGTVCRKSQMGYQGTRTAFNFYFSVTF
jgi:hypothetical protein